jgi:hypothetical protein
MIKFALACDKSHDFESWFPDGAAYEEQSRRGLVACPECGSTRVGKAIMAPAIIARARAERAKGEPAKDERAKGESAAAPVALLDEPQRALREAMRTLRREIEANTDDVGAKFPEVARAIHAGDAPERAIRGQANREEIEALVEEGVGVLPLPFAPDDFN